MASSDPQTRAHRVNRRYVVTLAVAAGLILVIGSLLRPRQPTTDAPVRAPSQAELSRLTRMTQRRVLEDMTDYLASLASDVRSAVVALPSLERTGLMWEPAVVLTVRTEYRFPSVATLSAPRGEIGAAAVVSGPQLPIATVRTSEVPGLSPPRRRAAATVEPGEWTLAVWRRLRELSFVPTHFLGTARIRCGEQLVEEMQSSVAWSRDMAGGGLFDLDGTLIGVIVPCADRLAAVTVGSVEAMLRQGRTVDGRLLGRYGVQLEFPTEEEQAHFDWEEGVIVREIWTGYLADTAGLRPGDLLVAINAEPIGSLDQLEPLADSTDFDTFDVEIRRGDEALTLVVPADPETMEPSSDTATASGIVWEPVSVGYLVDGVIPGSPAESAGIKAGDRLVRIDTNEPDDLDHVVEALSPEREAPVFLEIARGGRRWGVLLP